MWSPFNILAPNDWRSLKSADHYSVQERDKKMALYVSYRQVEYWRLQEQLNHSVCVIRQLEQRYNLSSPEEVLKFPSNSALFAEYNPSSDICFQKSRSTDPGDVQSWVIYTRGAFYYGGYAYPRKGFPPWHTVSTSDMVKHFRLNFNWIFQLPLRSQLTFYARYDVNSGIEYSIDLRQKKLSNRANGKSHVNLLAPLMDFKVKETKSLSNERVHFVVPISSGRTDTIHSFIVMYERVCLLTKQLTSLILAVYGEETYTAVTKMINDYQLKYPNANFTVLKGMGTFSRSRALNLGMQELKVDDLAFHCDVDMEITNPGFLDRCRMNTVRGESVYFPEVFKHYNVDLVFRYKKRPKGRLPIRRDLGHWGAYGYGMVCIYKADFLSVGGMDNQTEGWGQEDVDFFTRVLERLIIFRAPDPALRHHWHQKNCSAITTTVEKYNECHDSKTLALGGRKELGRYILELENNED